MCIEVKVPHMTSYEIEELIEKFYQEKGLITNYNKYNYFDEIEAFTQQDYEEFLNDEDQDLNDVYVEIYGKYYTKADLCYYIDQETFEKQHEILNEQKAKEMPNLIKIITEDDDKIYIFIDLNRQQVKELANTIQYYEHTTSCPKCGNGTFYAEIYGKTKILNIVCSKCTNKIEVNHDKL